ncbi:MAG: hypothetical protein M3P01_06070 [Actinomycetota bacterium]|nr:hypothetical protein [Actinomycetota bacterium]
MPKYRVTIEVEPLCQSHHIPGAVLQGAGFGSHLVGEAVTALVDQDQPELVGQGIQVVTEFVVVQTGASVKQEQRIAVAPLLDEQPRVTHIDVVPVTRDRGVHAVDQMLPAISSATSTRRFE